MSQKSPSLQSTSDYAKFELCQFNRNVEKTANLKDSMSRHGFIPAYPIHCTNAGGGKLQIKSGHHRFEVAQELGIAVFYVVSNDDATVHELEKATARWKQSDYLASFVRCGMEHYKLVARFHYSTGIPLGVCISMLSGESAGSGNKLSSFKDGTYFVTDVGYDHAEAVADIVKFCFDHGVRSRDAIFLQSISRCLFVGEFSVEIFKRRVAAYASMLKPCRSVVEQTEIFESVYNRGASASSRLPLSFLANKVMNARSAVTKKVARAAVCDRETQE